MTRRFWIVCCAALAGCATYRVELATPSTDWRSLERLAPGTELRVFAGDGMRRGRFDSVTADALTLQEGSHQISIRRDRVDRVIERTVKRRSRVVTSLEAAGAWILMGGVMSLFVRDREEGKLVGTLAVIGAAEGALISPPIYTERAIYVRRVPRRRRGSPG